MLVITLFKKRGEGYDIKKLKNNKGMTAIHYVIIMMIIFYFIAFLLDVADVSMKKYAAIRQLTTVSRVVGRQGE